MHIIIDDITVAGIRDHLIQTIKEAFKALGVEASVDLAKAPDPKMGDLGFPCFSLAKTLRKAPPQIAKEIAAQIKTDPLIDKVQTQGAYVNFHINRKAFVKIVLREILTKKEKYGSGQVKSQEHWMVEYSSPNTNKPLHLGHLRNSLLGSSIASILSFYGHKVTRINLVNDRGVHICKSMLAYQKWGNDLDPQEANKKGDHLVGEMYVLFDQKFSEEYKAWQQTEIAKQKYESWKKTQDQNSDKPTLEKIFFDEYKDEYFNSGSVLGAQVRDLLIKWEQDDKKVRLLWEKMNQWVLDGFDKTYDRMGVKFDRIQYESQTYTLGKAIVQKGLDSGVLTQQPDGAVVCDLTKVNMTGEKVLLRSDGTSVYMTQDLGTAVERLDDFNVDRLVYVVGDEQIYHFQVLFNILGLLRPDLFNRCLHLAYGMIRLPEGKMKSREGKVVDADDLMDEMHDLAQDETERRTQEGKAHTENITKDELEYRAEKIGMAALKYFLLKFTPHKSFEYDPKESIDFLGQTGPYCLFNYARTRSLLRKAGNEPNFNSDIASLLGTEQEIEIIRLLSSFEEVVSRAANSLDPSKIAEFLFELCKSFAFIFTDKENHPIVTCEDKNLRNARLMLAAAVGYTVKTGLALLGIDILEEM